MTLGSGIVLILVAIALIGVAGLLAAAETAFTRVNRSRADALVAVESDDPDGEHVDERIGELQTFSRRPLTTVATLALTQLAAQVGALACAWLAGTELAGRPGAMVAVVITAAILFGVVALARIRSLMSADTTAVGLVPILRAIAPLGGLTGGIVRLARRSSAPVESTPEVDEQQLLAIVGQASAIDVDEEMLIKRAMAFDDTLVGEIMTPRTELVILRSGFAVKDALEVASLHGLSRIPVTEIDGDVDDIIGAVHVKDLVLGLMDGRAEHDIDLWMREVPVVPQVQRISHLLDDLKTGDLHLAVVVDEHGGVAGVVTLEDILEELVGEIADEFDQPEPDVELIDTDTVWADGRCEITRIESALGVAIGGDFRTIAGCVFNGLGRVPEVGDVLTLEDPNLELRVLRMQGRRIARVEVISRGPVAVAVPETFVEEATVS